MLLTGILSVTGLMAQQEITLYYDSEKTVPKEQFTVSPSDPSVLDGSYTAFFSNGAIRIKGHYEHNVATGFWEYFYENAYPKMRGELKNNVNHGLWEYFYENGKLQMKGVVYDSIRQGPWQFFFENGSAKSSGTFVDGKKAGKWLNYYEGGPLKSEEIYKGDTVQYTEYYASGDIKLEGTKVNEINTGLWISYYENGAVRSEGRYKGGARHGPWKFYHENGKLSSVGDFLDGSTIGKWTYYYENGSISAEGAEKEGVKEGYWKLYHSDGDFKGEALFNEGEGAYREFYEEGTVKVKGYIKNGLNQGKWEYYYEDGTLEGEGIFVNGKGSYTGYYKDGGLKMKGTVEHGERTGIWELYKPDGTLAGYYESIYEDNKPAFRALRDAEKAKEKADKEGVALNPEYLYRKKKLRYYSPRINELRAVIVGINPLGLVMYRLPLSIEYYMQERLGYEVEVGLERNPFFYSGKNLETGTVYQRGGFVAFKQKFYHPDTRSGILYFGHRLGFDYLYHMANIEDSSIPDPEPQIIASEKKVTYMMLLGTRLMKDADIINTRLTKEKHAHSLTFDLSLGLGIGYRFFNKAYDDNAKFEFMLKDVNQSKVVFPIYLGATVGYVF